MIPEFKPKTDPVNANQATGGPPKEPVTKNLEKITNEGSQKAASQGASLSPLADAKATEMQTPASRESITTPLNTDYGLEMDPQKIKESEPKTNLSNSDLRKLNASVKLFDQKLSPGYQKLLIEMIKFPKQLEADIGRLGTVIIGNKPLPASDFASGDADEIYQMLSNNLQKYISQQNPNLKLDKMKIDEILYSTTQNASGDLMVQVLSAIPDPTSWVVYAETTVMEDSFSFEKPWVSKSDASGVGIKVVQGNFKTEDPNSQQDVLVVNKKTTQTYVNIDDPDAKPKTVVMDARVKHNLKTSDVSYEFEISVQTEGNSRPEYRKIWDPTK